MLAALAVLWSMGGVAAAGPEPDLVTDTRLHTHAGKVAIENLPLGAVSAPPSRLDASRLIVRFRGKPRFLDGTPRTRSLSARLNVHLASHPPGLDLDGALARYRANPEVLYAEPDYEVSTLATPNDPDFLSGLQWDMSLIAAELAWDRHTDSGGVVVAVIDTGIDLDHPDLAGNLFRDPDQPAIRGYTCMGGSCVPGGDDDNGHGTHVAGTIGAVGNDSLGMAGINWKIALLPIKFLGPNGSGNVSDAVLGFDLLAQMKARGINLRVTNNSWGGGGYSQALMDAMVALEGGPVSTLHVCAAGNSGLNADHQPMYPAAYPSRGIVSVMATDSNDQAASFTNYGIASVDLAAPGVAIHSTVPTGTCSHCTTSGYKLLSGTSMASPHVAGVAAALLAREPGLTAHLARDALLHPASHDPLTQTAALRTTTGGRLNFAATLGNSVFLANPELNAFPTLQLPPDIVAGPGQQIDFPQQASDPDGDVLRISRGRVNLDTGRTWLFGWQSNRAFPEALPFTAPALGRVAAMSYELAASDGRGGGVSGRNWAILTPSEEGGLPPTGILTVPTTASVGEPVTIRFNAQDPEGGQVAWDVHASGSGGSSGLCCLTGTSTTRTFNQAGAYRITVQGIDASLLTSPTYSAVVHVGGASGQPPVVRATTSQSAGPVPLTVAVDASASLDEDGTIRTFFFDCAAGYASGQSANTGQCTFDYPGSYWIRVFATDDQGLMGTTSLYVVATPAVDPIEDLTPPEVAIVAPLAGSAVWGSVAVSASAWDDLSGVREVRFYLDGETPTQLIGTATSAPYQVTWDTSGVTPGYHELKVRAWDGAGNASAASSIGVEVSMPPTPPSPPASVAAVQNSADIEVRWVDTSANESGFRIGREAYNAKRKRWGEVVILNETPANATMFLDLAPTTGTYRYSVQAFNESGASTWASVQVEVTSSGGGGGKGGGKKPR